mmetsp:Transcript_7008/g.7124  ORF Transcript_7008/g.7124 Transcript_7008/m.7124 type:complete len:269 (-) Transcript_7008:31-837(-)
MITETQAFLAMSTDEDCELSFDLCFECTSNGIQCLSHQQSSSSSLISSDKDLSERSIDKQPDLSSDSYLHPNPNSPLLSNQEILQTDDFNKKTAKLSDFVSLEVRHERDATNDKRLSDIDISLIPDFPLNDSHSCPLPDYSHSMQKDSFTSNNEIQKIKTRIADSVSLRMKHERDAETQKEIENKLFLELSKLVSNDSHELFAHHTDCKLCLGEKGMAVECLNKDCEYSFDLCFDCGEIQNNSPFPIFLDEQSEKTIQQKPTCEKDHQ